MASKGKAVMFCREVPASGGPSNFHIFIHVKSGNRLLPTFPRSTLHPTISTLQMEPAYTSETLNLPSHTQTPQSDH